MAKVVLVVDDEPIVREIMKELLEASSFHVLEAANGKEAFAIVKSQPVDCVLSDIRMPGGNGIELAQNIYDLSGTKPKVLLMTGYSDFTLEQAQKLNILSIISKPFDPEEVLNDIVKVLS